MKVKSESEVAQSCLTLSDPMDCSLPASSVHGIFQAGVLEWDAIAFSDGQGQEVLKDEFYLTIFLFLHPSPAFVICGLFNDQCESGTLL